MNSASTSTSQAYEPKQVEQKWTDVWFGARLFDLQTDPDRPSFSCALPPPNITGNLHLGHALNGTIQDVLTRWKRMLGYNVLWQPGTDHAGISTQMVVERRLKKEGINRHQLGREKFLEECWRWRKEYGDNILSQYRRLGVSFSWDRLAFTLDPSYVKAIYRAFAILYREGKIYRGHRVCNWCPRCLTSLSDLEVEHEEKKGKLYLIKYLLADGKGSLTVATTRPESMFGDVAVAVHPEDPRYKEFIGKKVKLPLTDRELPVVGDSYVDREFGTGALKITPAHDANDWEIGQRHGLPSPVILDPTGHLCANEYVPQNLQKLERFEARKQTVADLQAKGLLVEEKDYVHGVGHCERCNTVIEPYLSEQWYLKMKELAQPAIEAVEKGHVVFVPERYAATYLDWMRNIRDWNISRQLWWGHRIPVWTCKACQKADAYEDTPKACSACGKGDLEQDQDVLDTWFSSALWPFATLGWPDKTPELDAYYPTTILSTAREIINLWVSRMIFTSLKFVGKIPFKHVLIHPVIQTADGKRMSKSKGNAIDPLDMIDKYGADANRFWFASLGIKGDQDVKFREDRLEEYKRFANKLWNAGRLVLDKLSGWEPKPVDATKASLAGKWILSEYAQLIEGLDKQLTNYDFAEASDSLHTFIWDYFCDWYLEIAKWEMAEEGPDGQTKAILYFVFEGVLRALHPIMPFITEELWDRLEKTEFLSEFGSIMFAPYPRPNNTLVNAQAQADMSFVIKVVRCIRNIKQTFDVAAKTSAAVTLETSDKALLAKLAEADAYIRRCANAEPLTIRASGDALPMAASETVAGVKVMVPLGSLIDVEKTEKKLVSRKEATQKRLQEAQNVLEKPGFRDRAPADKVKAAEQVLSDLHQQLASIEGQLALLK